MTAPEEEGGVPTAKQNPRVQRPCQAHCCRPPFGAAEGETRPQNDSFSICALYGVTLAKLMLQAVQEGPGNTRCVLRNIIVVPEEGVAG